MKLYLKCLGCGEVFDELETAHPHRSAVTENDDCAEFVIVTEEEAF